MFILENKNTFIMIIKEIQNEIILKFNEFSDWDDKYSYLIKLGKELKAFPEELRIDKFKVNGCQSQVWIHGKFENGLVSFDADSDAMIVKGLIGLLVKVYSGHSPKDILENPPDFLEKIGIDKHLSPTRKNGLAAMMKQIKMYALAFSTLM